MFICAPLGLLFINSNLEQPCRDQRVSALRCCESWKKNLQKIESPSLLLRLARQRPRQHRGTYQSTKARCDKYVPSPLKLLPPRLTSATRVAAASHGTTASQGCCCQAAQPCRLDGLCLFWMIFRQKKKDDSLMENLVFQDQVCRCLLVEISQSEKVIDVCRNVARSENPGGALSTGWG